MNDRLRQIKGYSEDAKDSDIVYALQNELPDKTDFNKHCVIEDVIWLIKRVQELENRFTQRVYIKDLKEENKQLKERVRIFEMKYENTGSIMNRSNVEALQKDNERLREVNERYQKGLEHYERSEFVKTEKEREVYGRVARQTLKGDSYD